MTQIEILRDQLVSRTKDEHGNRIKEWDVWYEGQYLGTIIKIGFTYWDDATKYPKAHFSLVAALENYLDLISDEPVVELLVPTEVPEKTIWNFLKGKF